MTLRSLARTLPVLMWLLFGPAAQAQIDIYWNGGSGDWTNGANWQGGSPAGSGQVAHFVSGTGTINANIPSGGSGFSSYYSNIIFDGGVGNYTISGGPILFYASGSIELGSSATSVTGSNITETIAAPITTVGSLSISNNSTNATDVLDITSTATITMAEGGQSMLIGGANTGSNIIAASITGAMVGLGKSGNGTWILTGSNSYTTGYGTTISGGVLQIGNGGTTGNIGTGGITDNGSLVYDRSNTIIEANSVSGSGSLTQAGTGTLVLTGGSSYPSVNGYTGGTTINAGGTIQIGNGGATGGLGSGGIVNNGALVYDRDDSGNFQFTETNVISGSGSVSQISSTELALNAANSYTGLTRIDNGIIFMAYGLANGGVNGEIGASSSAAGNLVFGNGTLFFGGGTTDRLFTIGDSAGNSAELESYETANFTNTGAIAFGTTGTHTLILGGTINTLPGSTFAPLLQDQSPGNATYLTVNAGTLIWILTGNNTFTGLTTVTSGELDLDTTGGTAIGGNLVVNGGKAVWDQSNEMKSTASASVSSGTISLGVNSQTLAGVQMTGGAITGTTGTLTSTTAYDFQSGTASANLAGSVGLTKSTSGTVVLSGSNIYTGTTAINGGVLNIGSVGALGTGTITFGGGTLQYGTGISTDYSAQIFNSTAAISVDTNGQFVGWNFPLDASNTGGLTKLGTGTLILLAGNSYSGLTTVSAGELDASGINGPPGYAVPGNVLINGGTFALEQPFGLNPGSSVTISSGTFNLGFVHQTTAAVHLLGGTIAGTSGVLSSATSLDLESGTVTAGLDGTNGLTKTTSGTVTFSGLGTYLGTGTAHINGGVLFDSAGIGLGTQGTITFGGGTLRYGTASGFDYSSQIAGSTGAIMIDTNGQNITFENSLAASNTGGLTKLGSGTLTLAAGSAYTGTTTIAAGTLYGGISNTQPLTFTGGTLELFDGGDYSGVIVNSTSAISINTDPFTSATFASSISSSNTGGLTKLGLGTLALAASNAYTGLTTVSAGELDLAATSGPAFTGNLSATSATVRAFDPNQFASTATLTINTGTLALGTFNQSVASVTLNNSTLSGTGAVLTGTGTFTAQFSSISASLAGSAGLNVNGGIVFLSGQNTYTGMTTLSSGTLVLNSSGALGGGGNVTFTGGTLSYSTNNTTDLSSRILNSNGISINTGGQNVTFASSLSVTDTGTLTKSGTGTLLLAAGANVDPTIQAGTLQIEKSIGLVGGSTSSWTATNIKVASGAMLALNVGGAGQFTATNLQQLLTLGTSTGGFENGSAIGLDTTNAAGGNFTYSIPIANTNSGTNTLSLVKLGTGTLTLSGANSYSGSVTLAAGALSINTVNTGSATQSLGEGKTVLLGTSGGSAVSLLYTGSGGTLDKNITAVANATIQNSGVGPLTLTGTLTKANTVLTFNGGAQGITLTGRITGGTGSTFNSDLDVTGGLLILANPTNNYTGPTVITAGGTLRDGVSNAVPTGSVLEFGSTTDGAVTNTFDLNGSAQSIAAITTTSNVAGTNANVITNGATSGTSTLTVTGVNSDGQSTASSFAGTIKDGAQASTALTIQNAAVTLSGSNSYSGATTVSSGTLLVSNTKGSATGSGQLLVSGGATLGGYGSVNDSGYSIQGTSGSNRANLLVGMNSASDANTAQVLTLAASGNALISNANLTFNLNAQAAGGLGGARSGGLGAANSGTELSVGNTQIDFDTGLDSVQLTLNLENEPGVIAANTPYVLFAGTAPSGGTGANNSQYGNLTLGTLTTLAPGVTESKITGSNLQLVFTGSTDAAFYGANSYLVLYQNLNTGVDDIDIIVVPEPGTWALMLGGLAGLIFWQRRRSS